jgi:hypothetical protein
MPTDLTLLTDILRELRDVNTHLSALIHEVERLREDVQGQTSTVR